MQVKIALCEDNFDDQLEIGELLKAFEKEHSHQFDVHTFANTDELYRIIERDGYESFDAYLLDIAMSSDTDGMEFAKRIREHRETIPIIFITSHKKHSYESFGLNILHYIGKPIDKNRFFVALERLINYLENNNALFACIINGIMRRIPFREILYLRTDKDSRYLLINNDKTLRFRRKLVEVLQDYPDNFVLCDQSCAANIEHVLSIHTDKALLENYLLLRDSTKASISRRNLTEVRRRFAERFGLESRKLLR